MKSTEVNGQKRSVNVGLVRSRVMTDQMFEESSGANVLQPVEIAKPYSKILDEPLVPMEIPADAIRQVAYVPNAENAIAEYAGDCFDAETSRLRRKSVCLGILAGLKEIMFTEPQVRKIWADSRMHMPRVEQVACEEFPKFFSPKNVPAIAKLFLFFVIFAFAIVAEFANATYLILTSGLGIDSFFGAICFGGIYVLAPFVVFEFISHDLSFRSKCRWSLVIKIVATPLVLLGTGLFAFKMGAMHDSFDAFSSVQPWQPKLWITLLVSMVLLAITVMVIPPLLHSPMSQLWPQTVKDSVPYLAASERVIASNHVFAEYASLKVRVTSILEALSKEKKEFVARCLSMHYVQKADADARAAVARIEAMTKFDS